MKYTGKKTKNNFKKQIKGMNKENLEKALADINLEFQKANNERSKGVNPYDKGKFLLKLMRWKRTQIINMLKSGGE